MPTQIRGLTNVSVLEEIDRLLGPKTLAELAALEKQISDKLDSNEPIDFEYWEQLLQSVGVYKAKGDLHAIYRSVIENRLNTFRKEQQANAANLRARMKLLLGGHDRLDDDALNHSLPQSIASSQLKRQVQYSRQLDPEPELRLRVEDQNLEVVDEENFLKNLVSFVVESMQVPRLTDPIESRKTTGCQSRIRTTKTGFV